MAASTDSAPVRYLYPNHPATGAAKPVSVLCILSARTCTLAGLDASGAVVAFEEHPIGDFNPALANHPLLTTDRSRVRVLVADDRQLVIPEGLYHADAVEDWMQGCFFRMPDEALVVTRVAGAPYRVATIAAPELGRVQEAQPPVAGVYALGATLLQSPPVPEGAAASVLLTADACFIALWKDAQLLASVAYPETDAESVAYRLLGLLSQNHVAPTAVQVAIACLSPDAEQTARALEEYVPVVWPDDLPEASGDGFPYRVVARALSRIRACVL